MCRSKSHHHRLNRPYISTTSRTAILEILPLEQSSGTSTSVCAQTRQVAHTCRTTHPTQECKLFPSPASHRCGSGSSSSSSRLPALPGTRIPSELKGSPSEPHYRTRSTPKQAQEASTMPSNFKQRQATHSFSILGCRRRARSRRHARAISETTSREGGRRELSLRGPQDSKRRKDSTSNHSAQKARVYCFKPDGLAKRQHLCLQDF